MPIHHLSARTRETYRFHNENQQASFRMKKPFDYSFSGRHYSQTLTHKKLSTITYQLMWPLLDMYFCMLPGLRPNKMEMLLTLSTDRM